VKRKIINRRGAVLECPLSRDLEMVIEGKLDIQFIKVRETRVAPAVELGVEPLEEWGVLVVMAEFRKTVG
jgi:hypothetical protein